jgi:drug/metabolite transporter (DMT)-like permease
MRKKEDTMLNSVSTFVALLAGISIAVERLVEVIKGAIPVLANPWTKRESWRRTLLQVLAVVVGAGIASQMQSQLAGALGSSASGGWGIYLMVGVMASGGSGLWNHALDIVRAIKVDKELTVANKVSNAADKTAAQAAAAGKI